MMLAGEKGALIHHLRWCRAQGAQRPLDPSPTAAYKL